MAALFRKEFYENLHSQVDTWANSYKEAQPFPSIVLDNFLPVDLLNRIIEEFPSSNSNLWHQFNNAREVKLGSTKDALLPPLSRQLMQELNSGAFLEFLEKLTGIKPLISDSKLLGGGLHQILPGGKLAIHADFNKHPENFLDRRLNLLIYLNKDWDESYGGHFEMWDTEMTKCVQRVLPVFNRCVVFSTTSTSYHGHPDPLACPAHMSRKSIALYYYTNGRPESEIMNTNHSTLFQERPGENLGLEEERRRLLAEKRKAEEQERLQRELEAQALAIHAANMRKITVKKVAKEILPPILFKALKMGRDKINGSLKR